jgi:hypothetical protein
MIATMRGKNPDPGRIDFDEVDLQGICREIAKKSRHGSKYINRLDQK